MAIVAWWSLCNYKLHVFVFVLILFWQSISRITSFNHLPDKKKAVPINNVLYIYIYIYIYINIYQYIYIYIHI